jgi:phage FluMu protein Com
LVEIERNKNQCTYCGTILATRETKPDLVKCPRCGFDNERGDRYCNNCGKVLVSWAPVVAESKKMDPATLSILVSAVGSFFIPFGGPVVGLILGYKALRDARNSSFGEKSEKRAKVAIAIGWGILILSTLPICMAMGMPVVQSGCSFCQGLLDKLSNIVSGGG